MLLVTPIGTTAPFSAMSGVETNAMSLLCAGALPPSAFIVSSIVLVSNAALFQSACARVAGLSQPAAPSEREQREPAARLQHFPASVFIVGVLFRQEMRVAKNSEYTAGRPRRNTAPHQSGRQQRRSDRSAPAPYFAPPRIQCTIACASASFTCGCGGIGICPHAPTPPCFTLPTSVAAALASAAYFARDLAERRADDLVGHAVAGGAAAPP